MAIIIVGCICIIVITFKGALNNITAEGICFIGMQQNIIYGVLAADLFLNLGITGLFLLSLVPTLRFQHELTKRNRTDFSKATPGHLSVVDMGGYKSLDKLDDFNTPIAVPLNILPSTEKSFSSEASSFPATTPLPDLPHSERRRPVQSTAETNVTPKRSPLQRLFKRTVIGTCVAVIPTILNLCYLAAKHGQEPSWVCLSLCTFDGKSGYPYTVSPADVAVQQMRS